MLQRLRHRVREALGLVRMQETLNVLQQRSDMLDAPGHLAALHDAVDELQALRLVMGGTLLAEHAVLERQPRISVVMATRDRSTLLRRAVESVLAQSYPHWELVVVDDGSVDATPSVLDRFTDPRIIRLRTDGVRAAAARNAGLAVATGEWVAFLDDDNVMASHWLRGIASFAGMHPDASVVYGAQWRQFEREVADPTGAYLWFRSSFDAAELSRANYIDLGALAVRRDSAELHFDESLRRFIDWELVVRLAAVHEVHPFPVVSGIYSTQVDARITHDGALDAWREFATRLADPADPVGVPLSLRQG